MEPVESRRNQHWLLLRIGPTCPQSQAPHPAGWRSRTTHRVFACLAGQVFPQTPAVFVLRWSNSIRSSQSFKQRMAFACGLCWLSPVPNLRKRRRRRRRIRRRRRHVLQLRQHLPVADNDDLVGYTDLVAIQCYTAVQLYSPVMSAPDLGTPPVVWPTFFLQY